MIQLATQMGLWYFGGDSDIGGMIWMSTWQDCINLQCGRIEQKGTHGDDEGESVGDLVGIPVGKSVGFAVLYVQIKNENEIDLEEKKKSE